MGRPSQEVDADQVGDVARRGRRSLRGVPVCTIAPSSITTIRSPSATASSRSWVTARSPPRLTQEPREQAADIGFGRDIERARGSSRAVASGRSRGRGPLPPAAAGRRTSSPPGLGQPVQAQRAIVCDALSRAPSCRCPWLAGRTPRSPARSGAGRAGSPGTSGWWPLFRWILTRWPGLPEPCVQHDPAPGRGSRPTRARSVVDFPSRSGPAGQEPLLRPR